MTQGLGRKRVWGLQERGLAAAGGGFDRGACGNGDGVQCGPSPRRGSMSLGGRFGGRAVRPLVA